MRTRSLLKEFRGHTSFVNAACFSADQGFVVSAGSDGTVRFWSTRSGDCTASFTGLAQRAGAEAAAETTVISVQVMPGQPSNYLVCSRANTLALINSKGDVRGGLGRVGLPAQQISGAAKYQACRHFFFPSIRPFRQVLKSFVNPSKTKADFVAACATPQGDYIIAAGEDRALYCFKTLTGEVQSNIVVCC